MSMKLLALDLLLIVQTMVGYIIQAHAVRVPRARTRVGGLPICACVQIVGSGPTRGSSFFLGNVTTLGVGLPCLFV